MQPSTHASLLGALGAPSPAAVRPLRPSVPEAFTNWTRNDGEEGPEFVAGDGQARIAVREGCPTARRLLRTSAVNSVRQGVVAADTAWFTTAAGEYGAMVRCSGGDREETVAWLVGEVADTEISAVAMCGRPIEVRLLVERMLNEYTFGVGDERRRRFLYQPPEAWSGRARGLHADWLPPDPRGGAQITVLPAYPVAHPGPHVAVDRCLHGPIFESDLREETSEAVAAGPLRGRRVRKRGPDRLVEEVILRDDRFYYPFRLECGVADAGIWRAAFREVWQSTVPLARPVRPASSDVLSFWTT